jgi:23S rRNA (guanine745-N1)-methyltransferase
VAPLAPRSGHGLLRCPLCRLDLTATAGALVCPNRHGFDLAREGYVNLLCGGRHRPAAGGDSSAQLGHRRSFLDVGHFDVVASAIASHVQRAGGKATSSCWHVLDAGFGTGHHLARVKAALSLPAIGLGLDISKDAARHAARRWPRLAFAVADLWAEWPVKDAAVDLVISLVFSRREISLRPHVYSSVADGLQWHIRGQSICVSSAIASVC